MNEQLELDLVLPYPAAPAESRRIKRKAADLLLQSKALEIMAEACITFHRATGLDDPIKPEELNELSVLIGRAEWKKSKRHWERRSRRKPAEIRRGILWLQTYYKLSTLRSENQQQ